MRGKRETSGQRGEMAGTSTAPDIRRRPMFTVHRIQSFACDTVPSFGGWLQVYLVQAPSPDPRKLRYKILARLGYPKIMRRHIDGPCAGVVLRA